MKYGCRAHDYGCFTAQELAKVLADNGYNAAQLAMPKAIQGQLKVLLLSPRSSLKMSAALLLPPTLKSQC